MSFFTHFYAPVNRGVHPLFRLLDDLDKYSGEAQCGSQTSPRQQQQKQNSRPFAPRFDVRETDGAYVLQGELAGADRNNIEIEFHEPQTLVVKGRVERVRTSGTPPAGLVEDASNTASSNDSAAVEPAAAEKTRSASPAPSNGSWHHATVDDEATQEAREQGTGASEADVSTPATEAVEHAKPEQQQQSKAASDKYWVSERSLGSFSRTFNFPGRIDQDAVSATLENGILTVTVPKAKKLESRRITVN